MIDIEELSKAFVSEHSITHALSGVTLHIPSGSVYGIIGLSGAGKSTLVRCLSLLEKPSSGRILLSGRDVTKLDAAQLIDARRQIGLVFQHFNLLSSRTARGNIALPLELKGESKESIDARTGELLRLVGLEDKADEYPSRLSGGQKQRVGIARALASDPQVLLCDEATSALDPETTKSILELINDLNARLGLTIVLVTHELEVVKDVCTHVAVLHDGKVAESGNVEDVLIRPSSLAAKRLLGSLCAPEPPKHVLANLLHPRSGDVLKLSFSGVVTAEPVISDLAKRLDISVNILYGGVDCVRSSLFGNLIVELQGSADERLSAIAFLEQRNVLVEVLASHE